MDLVQGELVVLTNWVELSLDEHSEERLSCSQLREGSELWIRSVGTEYIMEFGK